MGTWFNMNLFSNALFGVFVDHTDIVSLGSYEKKVNFWT